MLTFPIHVGLRIVHAKVELAEGAQVAWFWRGTDARLGVIDEQRVHLRHEVRTIGILFLVGASVPEDGVGRLHSVVDRDGVCPLVFGARS